MFSAHDPRAQALLAVHHGTVSVVGTAYDGNPEYQAEDDTLRGWLTELHTGGYIVFDADNVPAQVRLTELGVLVLTAVFSIIPPAPPVVATDPDTDDEEDEPDDEDDWDDVEDQAGNASADSTGPSSTPPPPKTAADVTVNYYGLGPQCLDFVNGAGFRSIIGKHGYELRLDDHQGAETTLADDEPMSGDGYLSVVDPATDAHLYVLYDDETWSELESPGFIEILTLMDEYSKAQSQFRIFAYMPEDEDEATDELNAWVDADHPFYDREFDFTTGQYKEN